MLLLEVVRGLLLRGWRLGLSVGVPVLRVRSPSSRRGVPLLEALAAECIVRTVRAAALVECPSSCCSPFVEQWGTCKMMAVAVKVDPHR